MRIAHMEKSTPKTAGREWESAVKALLFAALTGIGAVIRIPLSPVPVTMQVFFVLLSGLVLGPFWGMASQIAYLLMGLCGAPFFAAPPHAGPLVLFGPTGGYLWGFVLAAGIAGWASRIGPAGSGFLKIPVRLLPIAACLAGLAAIYICGASWLAAWLALHGKDAALAFELGVKPFILVDLAKASGATAASYLIPKRSFGV
ncbi:biotin transporter BioY [Candidatus Solincola tengchongensis]|uniref:biotin transporter BioY n=1 Tax=Candidatus Solincola tengchongensis TaxID=2900693 RepID=UPI00257E979C|nr:biotin transporter BioY [Candidatus Solincola tengchongensis]